MIQPLQLLRTAERGDCVRERDILFAIDPRPYRRAPHRRLIGTRRLSPEGVRIKARPAPLFVQYPAVYFFRSEEHTSELQSLMRISYAVFCLKKKTLQRRPHKTRQEKHSNQSDCGSVVISYPIY